MSNPITQEALTEAIQHAPPPVLEILLGETCKNFLLECAKKYKLHVDEMDMLAREILGVALGLRSGVAFRSFITDAFTLPKEESMQLYTDILKYILMPVQDAFRLAQEREQEEAMKKRAEEEGVSIDAENNIEPLPVPKEHDLTNTPIGVIENTSVQEHMAHAPMHPEPARLETPVLAHVIAEKKDITRQKLSEETISLPKASTNVNIAPNTPPAGAAAEPPRLDRSAYHGADPYREPVDGEI